MYPRPTKARSARVVLLTWIKQGRDAASLGGRQIGRQCKRGRRLYKLSVQLLAASLILCGARGVQAVPLTPFRYEAQAQRHCPGDSVVWLDFRKGRYYLK